jgi:predicted benzoate:H+ symporter BenE
MPPEKGTVITRIKNVIISEAKCVVPRFSEEATIILAGPLFTLYMSMPESALVLAKFHISAGYLLGKFIEARKKVKK